MPASIAAQPASPKTRPGHRSWCRDHPSWVAGCGVTRKVRGTTLMLTLVEGHDGPAITFDPNADFFRRGSMTLAEAGAFSATLDDLRAKAAQ